MPGAISLGFSLSYPSRGGALAIAIRKLGLATATKDGSAGQTYSAPTGMTDIQWYREALNSGRAQTAISGATGSTYTATAGDAGFRLVAKGNLSGVLTDAVALQVVYVAPILLDSFDTLSNYTASNVALSIDPSSKQGSGSLKIDRTGTGTVLATRTSGFTIDGSTSIDPSTLGVIYMATYVEPQSELQNPVSYVQFNRAGSFVGLVQDTDTQNINSNPNPADQALGWHPHNFNVSEHSGLNTAGAGTLSARYRSLPTVRHDALMARAGGRPTVCLTFDDCFATTATVALPYMAARNLRGVSYTVPLNVGKTNRLSKAQMSQLQAAGWDLACNFTNDDSNITTRSDPTTAASEAAGVRQWLVDNGFDNPGKNHGCYSEGAWSIAGTRVALSSCTADGSNVVTVPATDNANIGFTLAGSAIPAGTTVTSVVDSTHYQVSQNVPTRAALSAVLIDKRGAFYNGKMQAALTAQGFLTGRTTLYSPSQGHFHSRFGIDQALTLPACSTSMGSGVTVNQLISQYEKAKLRQSTIIYYIHDIAVTASAIGMTIAGFQQFIDYIAADVAAGNADNLTISEIWARDGGSSIPV